MLNIGHIGARITDENLAILNEGLTTIAGADQAVTAEEIEGLVQHLESHGLADGEDIVMGLPNEAGTVRLQRIMGSWKVMSIMGAFEDDG